MDTPRQPELPPDSQPAAPRPGSRRMKFVLVVFISLLAVPGILYGAFFLWHALTHESTDDAFVDGHIVAISPKVAGKILAVHVGDNQDVEKGALLFEIDPRDFEAQVAQKKAALAAAQAQQQSAAASEAQAKAHIKTIDAAVASARATMDAAQAAAKRQQGDLDRNRKLVSGGAISTQDFEHSSMDARTADANLESRAGQVTAAAAYLEEANSQAVVAAAQRVAAEAEIGKANAELDQAELQLSYTKITAPESGHVTAKAIEPGAYVQPGQSVFAIVPHEVWVTANFKESQIGKMRPGQQATITVDAFPGRTWRARVDSLQAGSGARFSLMPPENATGNFVKVVQRIPVKIVFTDPTDHLLGPGMSAVPVVSVPENRGAQLVIIAAALVAVAVVLGLIPVWLRKIRNAGTQP
jgi:membrane fusion protein (multidrug efflux system)